MMQNIADNWLNLGIYNMSIEIHSMPWNLEKKEILYLIAFWIYFFGDFHRKFAFVWFFWNVPLLVDSKLFIRTNIANFMEILQDYFFLFDAAKCHGKNLNNFLSNLRL